MNRIVLIGNGFDLAHGLKTTYKNFIDHFLKNKGIEIKENKNGHECDFFKIYESIHYSCTSLIDYNDYNELSIKHTNKFEIKNKFFWQLMQKNGLENWVDIENEYYQKLKIISKRPKNENPKKQVQKLHQDFKQIKLQLINYLTKEQSRYSSVHRNKRGLEDLIRLNISLYDIEQNQLKIFLKSVYDKLKAGNSEYYKSDYINVFLDNKIKDNYNFDDFYKDVTDEKINNKQIKIRSQSILFLSFNYTITHENYCNLRSYPNGAKVDVVNLQIHGSLKDDKNPIIFGFGDELDKDYQNIEDLDDNDYLENIKSIKYLETDNYRKMLEFAESDQFQICILGHSCGNSDRTLLNTLFEHENCISIKPFYHKKEDDTDNYSDIVRNISRNFTSKAKMRERVVNKTYTSPMPK